MTIEKFKKSKVLDINSNVILKTEIEFNTKSRGLAEFFIAASAEVALVCDEQLKLEPKRNLYSKFTTPSLPIIIALGLSKFIMYIFLI